MTSITCFPSIYPLISSSFNWSICPLSLFCFLFHAASLYTSQAPSRSQTQQIVYVPVTVLMMTSITCFPSIYPLISSSCNWAICPLSSVSFLSHSCCLYTSQAPDGLQTQQILYVPVTILMMPSITCFPSIYPLISSSSREGYGVPPISTPFPFAPILAACTRHKHQAGYKHSKYFMCL